MNKKTVFFFYGSLRQDHFNNYLVKGSKFIGQATLKGFKMVSFGSYPAIFGSKETDTVIGDLVVGLNPDQIRRVDSMERMAGYKRIVTTARPIGLNLPYEVVVYVHGAMEFKGFPIIESGDWNCHDDSSSYENEEENEPEPDCYDEDVDVPDEYHVTNVECAVCRQPYGYSDLSPEYVKAGYCSQGCAEAGGHFDRA